MDLVGYYLTTFQKYDFLIITIDVAEGTAVFYAQEDTGKKHIVEQNIDYTTLDVSVRFYLEKSEKYQVLMFPSDH